MTLTPAPTLARLGEALRAVRADLGLTQNDVARLAGVTASATGHDTLAATDDFFSYRRNTLKGVRDYGRGLSAVALRG